MSVRCVVGLGLRSWWGGVTAKVVGSVRVRVRVGARVRVRVRVGLDGGDGALRSDG